MIIDLDHCMLGDHEIGQGNDVARVVEIDGHHYLWCGFCRDGANMRWFDQSDAQLVSRVSVLRAKLADSGLSFDKRGNDFGAWIDWLHTHDDAEAIERYIEERKNDGMDHG